MQVARSGNLLPGICIVMSMPVLNYPTYVTIAKLLNIPNINTKPKSSKTLTVANQTVVPVLHDVTLTLNTTDDDIPRQFIILFAVADTKYNILGTIFFEEYLKNQYARLYIPI